METAYPNWFAHYAVRFFERHLSPLAGKRNLRFLQVGVFTGDASVWLLDNVLTGPGAQLVDVDTWEGSGEPEHEGFDWRDVERVYRERIEPLRQTLKVRPIKSTSRHFFETRWLEQGGLFDFVYVDGDHTAPAVLEDAVNAFHHLKPGGLLAFDDYLWKPTAANGTVVEDPTKAPAVAIDAFTACYADRLEVLEAGLQVWLRKTA